MGSPTDGTAEALSRIERNIMANDTNTVSFAALAEKGHDIFTVENGSSGALPVGKAGISVTPEDAILLEGEEQPRKVGATMGTGARLCVTFPKGAYGPVPTGQVSFMVLYGQGERWTPEPKKKGRIAELEDLLRKHGIPVPERQVRE